MASAPTVCNDCEKETDCESCCVDCEQMYCDDCSRYHRRLKATRSHTMVDVSNKETDLAHSNIDKDCVNDCDKAAVGLCLDCKQVLCGDCSERHYSLKATKNHTIIAAKALEPLDDTQSQRQRRSSFSSYARSEISLAQVQVQKGTYEGLYFNEFMSTAPADKELTRIRGIAFLSDGKAWKIVVADYKNRSLKLFNMLHQHVTSTDLKEDPRGIVAISNDQVAVTIADKKEIRIFKVASNKIQSQKPKTIKMKEKPYSIAFNKDHLAVETGESDDGAIRILHITGRERFVISGSTRSFGQFSGSTIRLELDYSKEVVFVVDIAKEFVHCVGFKNNLIWSVSLKSPRGIALYGNTLFIASSGDNRIYQMNATDGMIYQFLDEPNNRVKRPRYIAFNPDFKMLAVEIDGNHIKLYKIDRSTTEVNNK